MNKSNLFKFLAAVKSILCFKESKVHLFAEYVIIGTLLSFTMAIVFTSLAVWAINLYYKTTQCVKILKFRRVLC